MLIVTCEVSTLDMNRESYIKRKHRLWLCLPALLCGVFDGIITLVGQPKLYWKGAFDSARELAPMWRALLVRHPCVFAIGQSVYLLIVCAMIVRLPGRLSKILAVIMVLAHTHGGMSWLAYRFRLGYHWWILVFAFLATVTVICFDMYDKRQAVEPTLSACSTPNGDS